VTGFVAIDCIGHLERHTLQVITHSYRAIGKAAH